MSIGDDVNGGEPILLVCICLQVLSVSGLLFVMTSHLVFFRKRKENYLMFILLIVLTSGCRSLWWLITYFLGIQHHLVCLLQGLGDEYFYEASWYWPLFFAIYLYCANILDKEIQTFWPFYLIAWGLPGIMVGLGWKLDSYGKYSLWCRITHSYILLGLHEGILGVILIVQMYIFVQITYRLYQIRKYSQIQSDRDAVVATSRRLLLFLIVPAFCWSWGLADRGVQLFDDRKSITWLAIAHDVTSSAEGLLNAIVYGWDSELLDNWKMVFKTCFSGVARCVTCKRDIRKENKVPSPKNLQAIYGEYDYER